MAEAAKVAEEWGYDEVNINCGCPSAKTRDGCFGAVLMMDPPLVARITRAMREAVNIPVTVKCRLGVDDRDQYEHVREFVEVVSREGGVEKFIVHARKCLLHGLSPAENRSVPPLKYDWVFKLKGEFPHLRFVINGGFTSVDQVKEVLQDGQLEGCMVGRMAMNTPWELSRVDRELFGSTEDSLNREQILHVSINSRMNS